MSVKRGEIGMEGGAEREILSRLRTGHIKTNAYLFASARAYPRSTAVEIQFRMLSIFCFSAGGSE